MKRRKIVITIVLTIIGGLLSASGGILGNVATSTPLPPLFVPYLRFAWPAFGVVTILGISLAVWQALQEKNTTGRSALTQEKMYRQRILKRVQIIWINGVLEHSLHNAPLIVLGLKELPDAVADPWRLPFQDPDQPKRDLLSGTHITDVYDSTEGELLILGEPGSGKTTLLLELTRNLLRFAEGDEKHPIPVVFNLSSWAVKQLPLTEWLIEELYTTYRVRPRLIGQSWVENDQVLPLLDGLDEVAEQARTACVDAINTYRREHSLLPTVVCSRSDEYHDLIEKDKKHRLQLHRAVVVQPLTEQQIDDYLLRAGGQLAAMREALHKDRGLQELATTPLVLNILMLTYREGSIAKLGSARQIFATYVERMVKSKGNVRRYPLSQTNKLLHWLAQQMLKHKQTIFSLEQLQSDWIPKRREVAYGLSLALIGMLGGGFVGALVGALSAGLIGLTRLDSTLVFGLVGMLLGTMGGYLVPIDFSARWVRDLENGLFFILRFVLVGMLLLGLVGALVGAVFFGLGGVLVGTLVGALVWMSVCALAFLLWLNFGSGGTFSALIGGQVGLLGCVLVRVLDSGLVFKLHDGLVGALVGLLVCLLGTRWIGKLVSGLVGGLVGGLIGGLPGALIGTLIGVVISVVISVVANILDNWDIAMLIFGLVGALVGALVFSQGGGLLGAVFFFGLGGALVGGLIGDFFAVLNARLGRLVGGLFGGLVGVLIGVLIFSQGGGLFGGLFGGLVGGLFGALVALVNLGLDSFSEEVRNSNVELPIPSNAALVSTLMGGLDGALIGGLLGTVVGTVVGAVVGVLGFVLGRALAAALQQYILRFWLWQTHTFPWKAKSFLESATARILLRRVGGGYSFIHRLLLDYFADLEKDDA